MGGFCTMSSSVSASRVLAAPTPPVSDVTCRATAWLLRSGIQSPSGGVSRYYRTDHREYRAVSNEITGYAVSALVWLHEETGRPDCLNAALRAGRYLTRHAWQPSLATIPFENDGESRYAYFFDLGIVVRGLLALWRKTGEAEFRDVAEACGRSMAGDFRGPDGYHPVLSLPGKQPAPGEARWSRLPGCYQLKSALAWHGLERATACHDFGALYDAALAALLPDHAAFLTAESDRIETMNRLHAYCYFLEGLLPRATLPPCAGALSEGIGLVSHLLREIGPEFARSDVYAQLLRVRLYAAATGAVPLDRSLAAQEASALSEFQFSSGDPQVSGAFCFGRRAGALMPFANPVSTVFAIQALRMWDRWREGTFTPDVHHLI